MNKTIKYSLILGAVMTLSFCQGRRSSIYDPTGGENRLSAEQYLTGTSERALTTGRDQKYVINFTQADFQTCQQEYWTTGAITSSLCNQLLVSMYYGSGLNQYNSSPGIVSYNFSQPGAASSSLFDFDMGDWLGNNPGYANQWNQAYPNFQTPMNMQAVCADPSMITNMSYQNPCGELNYWYASYNMQGNQGIYNMYNGNINPAQQFYGPTGTMNTVFPTVYQNATGYYQGTINRDVKAQNEMIEQNLKLSWENLKATPKNGAMRIGITGINIAQSMFDSIISNFEARGSGIVAANAARVGYNNSITDYNYKLTNYYYYNSPMAPMNTMMTAYALNPTPETYTPPETFHWVVQGN